MLRKIFQKITVFSGFKLGLILTVVFCLMKYGYLMGHTADEVLRNLENTWLDAKFRIRGGPTTEQERKAFQEKAHVVIAAVDEKSVRMDDLGMWPWPRVKVARLVEQLVSCGAKVVGFDVVFAEPDSSRTGPLVQRIANLYAGATAKDPGFEGELGKILEESQGDQIFAKVLEGTDNVVLGYFFFKDAEEVRNLSEEEIKAGKDSIGFGTVSFIVNYPGTDAAALFPQAKGVRANLPVLSEAVELYGFFNQRPDSDRIYRRIPLIYSMDGNLFPSLSLQVLAAYYGQKIELLANTFTGKELFPGYVGLFLGPIELPGPDHLEVPVEREGSQGGLFRVNFYGKGKTFRHVSAGDLIHGEKAACQAVRDKVVLVGATTMGIFDLRPTPFENDFPGVEIHASAIENIITKNFMTRPPLFFAYEAAFMLLIGILVSWILNRFRLTLGMLVVLLLMVGMGLCDYFLLFSQGLQAYIVLPLAQLVVLFLGIAVYRYATEEREKIKYRQTFQYYLSKDVIDIMVQDTTKLKVGGERLELTVMFSDIRGFTTISEALEPEKLAEFINEYLTPMTEIVFQTRGTLDKYIGDALMAFWGAPVHFPDHAPVACEAALRMMEELARLREVWQTRGLPPIDIGIGINTGPMAVGNMGSQRRFGYTVLGDNVNLGSRLEGLNKTYGTHIIISEFTHAEVREQFTCRELDLVKVKGKNEPVRIFELLHRGPPDPQADAWISRYQEGLGLYRAQQWDQALAIFATLGQDKVAKLYTTWCEAMKAHPPGPDWDGVTTMKTK